MITLFRKIRRSLITSNKVNKYLFYALGEISLVVIGILIALQVNNLNESRKSNQVSKETLMNLEKELQEAKQHLLESLERNNYIITESSKFIESKNHPDSLKQNPAIILIWVDHASPYLDLPIVEQEIGPGRLILDNEDLKKVLTSINYTKNRLEERENYLLELWNNRISAFLIDQKAMLSFYQFLNANQKIDYQLISPILNSEEFKQLLIYQTVEKKVYIRIHTELIEYINKALEMI